jgi:Uma2 family endonuclease
MSTSPDGRERRWTEAEFLALPESAERTELLDGELVREPSPGWAHQRAVLDIASALRAWAVSRKPPASVGLAPLDVRFGRGRILQPDACVFLDGLSLDARTPVETVPDLCVEVVSGRRLDDRVTRRLVYAAAGVAELWTVLRAERLVERWTGAGLAAREEARGILVTPLLPDFRLDVAALLAD